MAEWGSGSFTPGVYDKVVPGAYIIISVTPNGNYTVSDRGYVAALLELPGGEDNTIITITKEQFEKNSEKYFGVPADDESLLPIREIFCKAHTLYIYRLNSGGNKAKGATGTAKYSGEVGNKITVTVTKDAETETTYDVATYYDGVLKDTQNVPEASDKKVELSKGSETKGQKEIKPVFIKKYGYVKTKQELAEVIGAEAPSEAGDAESDIFYFSFKDAPSDGENYAAIIEVDGKKYAQPLKSESEKVNSYISLKKTSPGGFVYEEETWKDYQEETEIDVANKSIKVSLYNYGKKVDLAALQGEPTEKIVDAVEFDCNASVAKDEIRKGTPASATITISGNKITVAFSDVPDDYSSEVRVKNGTSYANFEDGVLEKSVDGTSTTITYYTSANLDGEKTVEAVLSNGEDVVIDSYTYTCSLTKGDVSGADGSKLVDNDFVVFDKKAILSETGGDVYTGGTSGTVTGANYIEGKDLLDAVKFNTLALPTTDKETQDTFIEYTKTMRDEEGVKFQLVIPHSPERKTPINHEGIIEYSSVNTVNNDKYTNTGLTYWLAGAEAACPVQSNLTGTVYNGELEVEAKVTRTQQKTSISGGQILFNKMGDSVVLLRDINTLISVEENSKDKNNDFKKNQTIRVLDGLVQETADCFNNFFVRQHLANNEINRAELHNQLVAIRQRYATIGAINGYDETLMQIQPGEKLSDVLGYDGVSVAGAMEFLYFSLNLIQEV